MESPEIGGGFGRLRETVSDLKDVFDLLGKALSVSTSVSVAVGFALFLIYCLHIHYFPNLTISNLTYVFFAIASLSFFITICIFSVIFGPVILILVNGLKDHTLEVEYIGIKPIPQCKTKFNYMLTEYIPNLFERFFESLKALFLSYILPLRKIFRYTINIYLTILKNRTSASKVSSTVSKAGAALPIEGNKKDISTSIDPILRPALLYVDSAALGQLFSAAILAYCIKFKHTNSIYPIYYALIFGTICSLVTFRIIRPELFKNLKFYVILNTWQCMLIAFFLTSCFSVAAILLPLWNSKHLAHVDKVYLYPSIAFVLLSSNFFVGFLGFTRQYIGAVFSAFVCGIFLVVSFGGLTNVSCFVINKLFLGNIPNQTIILSDNGAKHLNAAEFEVKEYYVHGDCFKKIENVTILLKLGDENLIEGTNSESTNPVRVSLPSSDCLLITQFQQPKT